MLRLRSEAANAENAYMGLWNKSLEEKGPGLEEKGRDAKGKKKQELQTLPFLSKFTDFSNISSLSTNYAERPFQRAAHHVCLQNMAHLFQEKT